VDAPARAELSCARVPLRVAAGDLAVLPMDAVMWEGTCTYEAAGRPVGHERIRFRAGEVNAVRWPAL
jgi:hypothetical protein